MNQHRTASIHKRIGCCD